MRKPADLLAPLARAPDRRGALRRQSVAISALLATAAAGLAAGVPDATALLVAAALVQLGLASALAIDAVKERERARDLIAGGCVGSALPSIARERRRLMHRRHRLAKAIDRVRADAARRAWTIRSSRPLFDPRVVVRVLPELEEIASLLRKDAPDAAGIALTQHLLCDGSSPLYGEDPEPLRDALVTIRRRLRD
jgi:hypothetical protein